MNDAERVSEVERAFSDLRVQSWLPLGEGWMSRALLLNGTWVARFAKSEEASLDLEKEAAVLPVLATRVPLAVPRFERVGRQRNGFGFVLYRALPGEPMEETLGELPPTLHERLAAQLAAFISALQAIPLSELAMASLPSVNLHAQLIERQRAWMKLEAQLPRDEFQWVARRFEAYLASSAFHRSDRCFLHADLSPNHWIFDAGRGELSGVIDFGDCELGDPDYEYVCLLEDAGERFTRRVLELQGASDIDVRLAKLRCLVTFAHARGVLVSERYGKPEWREECLAALRDELAASNA